EGFNADVAALDGYAYVGTYGAGTHCPSLGVHIVDVSDPAAPRFVATSARYQGTSAEDVVVRRVASPFFTGDLLAAGIQRCATGNGVRGGLALVDVSAPHNPVELGFFDTGTGPRGVHELDLAQQDGRLLALLAVPNAERAGIGDVQIVDITDPR